MTVVIKDKSKQFIKASTDAIDRSLARMAIDIERLSKAQVPHDKGQLKASGGHRRFGFLQYRVEYNKEYALYQHEGVRQDGTHMVRRYSKPGKKKHYLIDPARQISAKGINYLKEEAAYIRI